MIFFGRDALLQGMNILEGAESAYTALLRRIGDAVGSQAVAIMLILTEGPPVEFSHGEYLYLRKVGVLIVRINRHLDAAERVRVFFRELAEFLQLCEHGSCVTRAVWELYAPREYNKVREMVNVQAW